MKPRGLGPCDLLTPLEAVRVLGMRKADGLRFLEARGLVRRFQGRPRVVAGELVKAFDDAEATKVRRTTTLTAPAWDEL